MGVVKIGSVYYERTKVPPHLEEAVAHVLRNGKRRQSWLKRSLRTKHLATANKKAVSVQMEFASAPGGAKAQQRYGEQARWCCTGSLPLGVRYRRHDPKRCSMV